MMLVSTGLHPVALIKITLTDLITTADFFYLWDWRLILVIYRCLCERARKAGALTCEGGHVSDRQQHLPRLATSASPATASYR
jgi:hypothetical protein